VLYRIQRQGFCGVLEQRDAPVGNPGCDLAVLGTADHGQLIDGRHKIIFGAQVQAELGLETQDASKRVVKPVRSDLT
jgi:hypothetical protein